MLRIVSYPHPALLVPTIPVARMDGELERHVGEMFERMYDAGGVGLAANQVALPYRLVVMNLDLEGHAKEGERVFINPRIVGQRGQVEEEEGCLSFPGLFAKIRRAREVTVEAINGAGESIRFEVKGIEARAWQHEMEHLEGKVFIDRFNQLAKLANRRQIQEFEKRFRRAQEEGRIPTDADIERTLAQLRAVMEARS